MRRDAALRILRDAKPELHRRYGVVSARLFGSLARAEDDEVSDVDVAVRFAAPVDVMALCGVSGLLSALFGRDVDIVAEPVRDPGLEAAIRREGILAF